MLQVSLGALSFSFQKQCIFCELKRRHQAQEEKEENGRDRIVELKAVKAARLVCMIEWHFMTVPVSFFFTKKIGCYLSN